MNTSLEHWIMRPIELDEMTHDNSSSILLRIIQGKERKQVA